MEHSTFNKSSGAISINGYFIPTEPRNYKCVNCSYLKEDPKEPGFSTEEELQKAREKYRAMPEKKPRELKINWTVTEEIGLGISNYKGIK